jgi:hypothetical protein
MKFNLFFALLTILITFNGVAHEGHSETSLKSIHGGIVKKTNNAFIEVVQDEGKIEIFVTGHDYKNIIDPKLSFKAIAEAKAKKIPLTLLIEKDHYLITPGFWKVDQQTLKQLINRGGKETFHETSAFSRV